MRHYTPFYILRSAPKRVEWLGTALRDLRSLPTAAQQVLGYGLHRVQAGDMPVDWRPMASIGAGVVEIRTHIHGEFRLLYVARFPEGIYVLHAFQKKTQKTSPRDLAVARARFALIRRVHHKV